MEGGAFQIQREHDKLLGRDDRLVRGFHHDVQDGASERDARGSVLSGGLFQKGEF